MFNNKNESLKNNKIINPHKYIKNYSLNNFICSINIALEI